MQISLPDIKKAWILIEMRPEELHLLKKRGKKIYIGFCPPLYRLNLKRQKVLKNK